MKNQEKEISKTIRVGLDLWRKINALRGYNDCDSFEDVIQLLYNSYKENNKTDEE